MLEPLNNEIRLLKSLSTINVLKILVFLAIFTNDFETLVVESAFKSLFSFLKGSKMKN